MEEAHIGLRAIDEYTDCLDADVEQSAACRRASLSAKPKPVDASFR